MKEFNIKTTVEILHWRLDPRTQVNISMRLFDLYIGHYQIRNDNRIYRRCPNV